MTPIEWAGAAVGVGLATSVVAPLPKGVAGGWRIGVEVLLSLGGAVLALVGAILAARSAGETVSNTQIWMATSASHPLVAAGFGCALVGIVIGTALRRDRVQHPLVQLVWSAGIGALLSTVVLAGAPGRGFEVRAGEVSATVLLVAVAVRIGAGAWVRATIPEDVVVPVMPETPVAPTWVLRSSFRAGDRERLDSSLGEWERLLAKPRAVPAGRRRRRHDAIVARRPRGLRRYCRRLARVQLVGVGLVMSAALAAVVGIARAGEADGEVLLAWWAVALGALALGYLVRSLPVRRCLEELIPEAAPAPPVLVPLPQFELPETGLEAALLPAVPETAPELCSRCGGEGRVKTTVSETVPASTTTIHHGIYGENPDYTTEVYTPETTVSHRVQVACSACDGSGLVPRPLSPDERRELAADLARRLRTLAGREALLRPAIDAENHRRLTSYGLDRAFFDALDA